MTDEIERASVGALAREIIRINTDARYHWRSRQSLSVQAAERALSSRGDAGRTCPDCDEAAKHAYSDATSPGFFSPRCSKHRESALAHPKETRGDAGTPTILQEENATLRKRIHHLEGHNQYFFRCESAWCNPDAKDNPALETIKQLEKRAIEAESTLAHRETGFQAACSECDGDGCAKCDPIGTIRKVCSGEIQVGDDVDALKYISEILPIEPVADREAKQEPEYRVSLDALDEVLQKFKSERAAWQKEREALRKALGELIAKLDLIHADESYQGVWNLAHIHGNIYRGPQYEEELANGRKVLAAPQPIPDQEGK